MGVPDSHWLDEATKYGKAVSFAKVSRKGQVRNAVSNPMQEVSEMGDEHEAMLKEFGVFVEAVETRLDKGAREYGERSFERPPGELVGEVMQELEDVVGWSFILWCRLRALEMPVGAREPEDPFLVAERERGEAAP